jgi:hypothetical protein
MTYPSPYLHALARDSNHVVVVFTTEDVESVLRRTGRFSTESWPEERMLRFLKDQEGSLSELLADKGLEILERELALWEETVAAR